MTRVNVVPLEKLTKQHIVTEHKEIHRAIRQAVNAVQAGRELQAPAEYVLGAGHQTFFAMRSAWVWERFLLVRDYMQRYYNTEFDQTFYLIVRCRARWLRRHAPKYWKQYQPTLEAKALNWSRLAERDPNFYKGVYCE